MRNSPKACTNRCQNINDPSKPPGPRTTPTPVKGHRDGPPTVTSACTRVALGTPLDPPTAPPSRHTYLTVFPRMYTFGTLQKASPSADVRTASARFKFIHESMETRTPEYVSPFFNSTSTGWPVEERRSVSGS